MPKFSGQQQARLIDEYIAKREELLRGRVDKMAAILFDKIFNEYLSQLAQANGQIKNNNRNISAVNGLNQIFRSFNKTENIPTVKSFIGDVQQLTPMNEVYFHKVADKPVDGISEIATAQVNKSLGIDEKGKLIQGGFADKFIRDETLLNSIKKRTIQAITQQKGFLQFKNEMKGLIEGVPGKPLSGGLQQYYRNYAYDTMMKVDRVNAEVFAKNLGLIYFYWSGGIINTTRNLCEVANGKIFNTLQLQKMTFETLLPFYRDGITKEWVPILDLGMWGCRHRKNYISDEEAARNRGKWFDINSISTEPIAERKPRVLNDKQRAEYKKFPKDDSLTGDNARLQEDSIRLFLANKKEFADEYIQRFGNVANTDDARKLFTEIGYNGLNASAVHEASSAVNKEAIKQMIASSKSNQVEMYAGGAGSGKTSAVKLLKPDLKDTAAAIIDGNLAGYEGAISKMEQFLSQGKQVNITYVYRDPADAWENGVIKRMLENTEEMGRVVTLKTFLHNTSGSYETIKRMYANDIHNMNGVNIEIVDNSLGFGKTAYMGRAKFDSIKYDEELRQMLIKLTKELLERGRINEEQYRALLAE